MLNVIFDLDGVFPYTIVLFTHFKIIVCATYFGDNISQVKVTTITNIYNEIEVLLTNQKILEINMFAL